MTTVNGGVCQYDLETQKALNSLYRQASAAGILGSNLVEIWAAEIKANGTYICI